MEKSRIGIIGKGRLAQKLLAAGCSSIECNITQIDSIRDAIGKEEYSAVINCAAFTDVDAAEKERLLAYNVNSFGPLNIAKVYEGHVIHISSDYIFDGENGPYNEDDVANPLSAYGFSKYWGEVGLRPYMDRVLIVRTTVLFDTERPNFVSTVYNQLKADKPVKVPRSIIGNPTHTRHLAEGILKAIENELVGVINISGKTRMSRYDTAVEIARFFDLDTKNVFDGPAWGEARRPEKAGFVLDKAKFDGIPLFSLWEGLYQMKHDLGYFTPPPIIDVPVTETNIEKVIADADKVDLANTTG